MKAADQLAGVSEAERGVCAKTDAAFSVRALGAEESDRERRDRGLRLGGTHFCAAADGVDGVEIHRQRRVHRVVGYGVILDARDAEVRGIVAPVNHDARDRRLADLGDEIFRQRRELLRDQERIAAAAHVEHALVIEIEAGLEAVVGAEDLDGQPRGHDLGDRGRDERLVSVLRDQLLALGVHGEDDRRWRKGRDLLLEVRQRRGGQEEQGKGEQARRHGESNGGVAAMLAILARQVSRQRPLAGQVEFVGRRP